MSESTDDSEEQFSAAQTGPLHYTVLSTRNDSVTGQRVNIKTLRCSCGDMTYNNGSRPVTPDSDEGQELCDHLQYVLDKHPQLTAQESALYKSMGIMEGAANLQQQIEEQSEQLEEAIVQLRDAQAGLEASNAADGDESDTAGSETDDSAPGGMTEEDVEKAAQDLKDAFDEHLNDMEVQAHAGHVWFKTGYDTEEEWPYPGVDETFQAVTAPDVVEYAYQSDDGPDHELYSEKPGEYWKNALRPEDVDEYISEVLE